MSEKPADQMTGEFRDRAERIAKLAPVLYRAYMEQIFPTTPVAPWELAHEEARSGWIAVARCALDQIIPCDDLYEFSPLTPPEVQNAD